MQDCSISIANALEILQSCTKPSICFNLNHANLMMMFSRFERRGFDGLMQDCSNPIANAPELLQSYTKPSICSRFFFSILADLCEIWGLWACWAYCYTGNHHRIGEAASETEGRACVRCHKWTQVWKERWVLYMIADVLSIVIKQFKLIYFDLASECLFRQCFWILINMKTSIGMRMCAALEFVALMKNFLF